MPVNTGILNASCSYRQIPKVRPGGVAPLWKRPPLDLHSEFVIEQLTQGTAQVSTVIITEMEIKTCNLYAQ